MIDPKQINQWAQDVINSLPPGVKHLSEDAQSHLHAALQATFSKLDLVTREEFDTQTKVLAKTRAKLEQLEQRLKELEEEPGAEAPKK